MLCWQLRWSSSFGRVCYRVIPSSGPCLHGKLWALGCARGMLCAPHFVHSGWLVRHNVLTQRKMRLRRSMDSFSCMRPPVICCCVSVSFRWDLSRTVSKWEIQLLLDWELFHICQISRTLLAKLFNLKQNQTTALMLLFDDTSCVEYSKWDPLLLVSSSGGALPYKTAVKDWWSQVLKV